MPTRKPQVKKTEAKVASVRRPRIQPPGKVPDKPSAAMAAAYEAAKAISKEKNFRIVHGTWVKKQNDVWNVCPAGAYLIKLGFTPEELNDKYLSELQRMDDRTRHRIFGLDGLLYGSFQSHWLQEFKVYKKSLEEFFEEETDQGLIIGGLPLKLEDPLSPKYEAALKKVVKKLKEYDL